MSPRCPRGQRQHGLNSQAIPLVQPPLPLHLGIPELPLHSLPNIRQEAVTLDYKEWSPTVCQGLPSFPQMPHRASPT